MIDDKVNLEENTTEIVADALRTAELQKKK